MARLPCAFSLTSCQAPSSYPRPFPRTGGDMPLRRGISLSPGWGMDVSLHVGGIGRAAPSAHASARTCQRGGFVTTTGMGKTPVGEALREVEEALASVNRVTTLGVLGASIAYELS